MRTTGCWHPSATAPRRALPIISRRTFIWNPSRSAAACWAEAPRRSVLIGRPALAGAGGRIGRVELTLARDAITASRNKAIAISLAVGNSMLLLGVGLVWYFSRRLARPVMALTDVTVALADGDLSVRALETGSGEIRVLES